MQLTLVTDATLGGSSLTEGQVNQVSFASKQDHSSNFSLPVG
jgi:hypothetical protein